MFDAQVSPRLGEVLGTICATVVGRQLFDVRPKRLLIGHGFARDYPLDGAVALTPGTAPSAYADCGTAEGGRLTGMRLATARSGVARSTRLPARIPGSWKQMCGAYMA